MPVTARSLRRNRNHAPSTRATAAVLASIVGAAGAAWGVATMFEPFRENFAKSSDRPAETTDAPMDPVLVSLPTTSAPAEDIAAGSPSAWRSESSLLRIAESLNTAVTPASGGGTDGGGTDGGGNGGNGGWIIPTPGRNILVPGGDGSDGGDDPWLASPSIDTPGRDGTPLACAAQTVAIVEGSNESALVPGRVIDEAVPAQCEDEADAATAASAEEAPADEPPAEGSSSTVQ